MIKVGIWRAIKELQYQSPLKRYFFPRYRYNFTPPQLCYLCQCLQLTRDVPGAVAEIGCASGATTVFLNKCLDAQGIDKPYFAVDTFSGFTDEDVDFAVSHRGKKRRFYREFQVNKKKWFDWTMRCNGVDRVESIRADVNRFDLTTLGGLAFALLDVDLYRPTSKALPELYEALNGGGVLVTDNCDADNVRWDGADQAYKEFVQELGEPVRVIHGKLGVIKKT